MTRTTTALDELADQFFAAQAALSPEMMTSLGRDQDQDKLADRSPAGVERWHRLNFDTLARLEDVAAVDATDRVTAAALRERLGVEIEAHAEGYDLMDISNIASGLHNIREIFDLMGTSTAADWAVLARRLEAIPQAVKGWVASQFAGIDCGVKPAIRQVEALAEQAEGWIGEKGFFLGLAERARSAELPGVVGEALDEGIATARAAYGEAIAILRDQIAPLAVVEDAVGPERYELSSRAFLGAQVDQAETYRWGLDQVAELTAQQEEICARLRPGLSVADTKRALDEDPAYQIQGSAAMQQWMQARADEAIANLHGRHFDIPEPARRIECMIAPTRDGVIYYTEPSEDFSRPGRMWWSVPENQTTFSTWRELTTVNHEGVPGHHLQLSQAIYNRAELNTWRRQGIWVSGHGEGWALYSEQLMADLGYLDDPAMRLGMLDGQALRAVRVVIDIGLHCGFAPPPEVGGETWTFDKALDYFNANVAMDPDVARFEVNRYFGWPGQAPSYKIGQRVWTEIRDELRRRDGATFDLKAFHARALNLGALGLDTLRDTLLA